MRPSYLRLLRIDDDCAKRDSDVLSRAPVTLVYDVEKWLDFCNDLALQRLPEFELLTIDFQFNSDQTTPEFVRRSDPEYSESTSDDPLQRLRWSNGLVGKNTGLVIGASILSTVMWRDLPVGVATYTGFPEMTARDVTSALLLAQIFVASGEPVPLDKSPALLTHTVKSVLNGPSTCKSALPTAVSRFRRAFLSKACAGSDALNRSSIWIKLDSVLALQSAISVNCADELDEKLANQGLEFYDRNGRCVSLSLHSLFLDYLVERNADQQVDYFRPKLTLGDLRPESEPGNAIRRFLFDISELATTNVKPVLRFLEKPTQTVLEALKNRAQRLVALLFACCDQFGEKYTAYGQKWDTLEWQPDPTSDFASLFTQLSALLKLLYSESKELPLAAETGYSVLKMVSDCCEFDIEHPLSSPLRYDLDDADPQRSAQRNVALGKMLRELVQWGVVAEIHDTYRAKTRKLPTEMSLTFDRQDLCCRLGFNPKTSWHLLRAIIKDALDQDASEFFGALESRPLPEHLRRLCASYVRTKWPLVPASDWPVFLKHPEKLKYWLSKSKPSGRQ